MIPVVHRKLTQLYTSSDINLQFIHKLSKREDFPEPTLPIIVNGSLSAIIKQFSHKLASAYYIYKA